MENQFWKMMINNASRHLKTFDPKKPDDLEIDVWQISEVLSLLTGKLKEDIVIEIMNADVQK